jgi:hypothetical protein
MAQQPNLLLAGSIVKRFGPTNVLKGFDLSIAAGEVHAFLGGNGAGKSRSSRSLKTFHRVRDAGCFMTTRNASTVFEPRFRNVDPARIDPVGTVDGLGRHSKASSLPSEWGPNAQVGAPAETRAKEAGVSAHDARAEP